jgi:26S proteasome non-ATPase regulatory subunit 9
MDDIHTPTVASGPTSGGHTNGIPKEQLSLQELIAEKDRVETELKALGQVLDSVRTPTHTCSRMYADLLHSMA